MLLVEGGHALLVDDDFELNDLMSLSAAPRHTAGQCCAYPHSNGIKEIFTGDAFHHPLQICKLGWSTIKRADPVFAILTRSRISESCADTDTLFLPAYFSGTMASYIITADDEFVFRFIEG